MRSSPAHSCAMIATLRGCLLAVAFVATAAGAPSRIAAQEMDVPVAIQIPLFLKVMTFDRQLTTRAEGELVVAIAYQSGHRASRSTKDEVARALAVVDQNSSGVRIRAVVIDLDNEVLGDALKRERVLVLYVAPLRGSDIALIAGAARSAGVTTVTGVSAYVALGLAVSVRLQADKPKLLINLTQAKKEGAEFSSELLKLVQVSR